MAGRTATSYCAAGAAPSWAQTDQLVVHAEAALHLVTPLSRKTHEWQPQDVCLGGYMSIERVVMIRRMPINYGRFCRSVAWGRVLPPVQVTWPDDEPQRH